MKKCFKYIVAGAFAVLMSFNAYAGTVTNSDAIIYVNGKIINGASAKISDGYTLVPVRFIAEELSCKVDWKEDEQKVVVDEGSSNIELTVGNDIMKVNGKEKKIPVAPVIVDSRVYVPLRAISEGLDIDITWNAMTRTVSVYSANAAKSQYNSDYSEAPQAVFDTIYLLPDETIVLPVNADPNKVIEMEVTNKDVCEAKLGYMDGKAALFITADDRGTSGIVMHYPGFSSTNHSRTTVNVRVVDSREKALINFDDMLSEKGLNYKNIISEIKEKQSIIEKENGIFIFDKNDEEYDKLYVGDTGMLIIPVDYDEKASGNFDIAYDFDSAIECSWGIYEGKHALMITSKDYAYIPVRITFTENKTGNVSFTVTDKDMDADEAPVVYSYGNNNINYSVWDFHVRAISDMSKDLSGKMDLVGNRIIHID